MSLALSLNDSFSPSKKCTPHRTQGGSSRASPSRTISGHRWECGGHRESGRGERAASSSIPPLPPPSTRHTARVYVARARRSPPLIRAFLCVPTPVTRQGPAEALGGAAREDSRKGEGVTQLPPPLFESFTLYVQLPGHAGALTPLFATLRVWAGGGRHCGDGEPLGGG